MSVDAAVAAAERTSAARDLIARAQAELVELVTVSALELCVLGGPGHPMFEEGPARAWDRLGRHRRRKVIESVTEGMAERGLLVGEGPPPGPEPGAYALKPELGVMLAARCRPSSIVIPQLGPPYLRMTRFFTLGDQADPVRAVVMEEPVTLPPDIAGNFPNVEKLGPLGWFYRYALVSAGTAAEVLAGLTIAPPRSAGAAPTPAWTVTACYPGSGSPGDQLSVRGDGTRARLDGHAAGAGRLSGAEYDIEGLRTVMLDVIAGPPR